MNYFLLLLTALSLTFQKITQQRYNSKCHSGVFFFSGMISFFVMCFFMVINRDWTWNAQLLVPALAFGISYVASTVFVVLAIKCGSLAKTTLIISYSLMIPAISGFVILHEPVKTTMMVGLVLLVISLWLTNHQKAQKDRPREKVTFKWIIFLLLGFLGNGMCATVQKLTPHYVDEAVLNQNMYMIVALGFSTVVMITTSFLMKETGLKMTLRHGTPLAVLCGFFSGTVNYLAMYLNQFLPASVMFPVISAGEIVLIFPYSLLICREKFTAKQWIGFAIGVLSVILLNI